MQKPRLSVFPRPNTPEYDQVAAKQGVSSAGNSHSSKPASASKARIQDDLDRVSGTLEPRCVTVRLATIVPLLLDAVEQNRAWLSDFADDTVRLDADLFEVLLAYQELRAEAAA